MSESFLPLPPWPTYAEIFTCSRLWFYCPFLSSNWPETEFLAKIQTKFLRVFLLAIHSHLYSFALRFLFLQTHATSYIFSNLHNLLRISTIQLLYTAKEKGENLKENHTPFHMVSETHTETSSLRTLTIMPKPYPKIVRSWIRLLLSTNLTVRDSHPNCPTMHHLLRSQSGQKYLPAPSLFSLFTDLQSTTLMVRGSHPSCNTTFFPAEMGRNNYLPPPFSLCSLTCSRKLWWWGAGSQSCPSTFSTFFPAEMGRNIYLPPPFSLWSLTCSRQPWWWEADSTSPARAAQCPHASPSSRSSGSSWHSVSQNSAHRRHIIK